MEERQLHKSTQRNEREIFAERLDELLYKKGIQNQELAWSIYVAPSTVSGWRTGYRMPDVSQIALIASALRVSSDYLLGISDDASEIMPKNPIPLKKKRRKRDL